MKGRQPTIGALVAGLALLIVGGAFLLRNLGVTIDWSVILPVILIAVGLGVVVLALRRPGRGTGQASVLVPLEAARRLELALRLGAGHYALRGGSAALVEAVADEPTIGCEVERAGDVARVRLSTAVDPLAWGWHSGLSWRIGVTSGVQAVLDVQAGAGAFDLDLSSVALASATMGIGAADLRVVLPRPRGEVPIKVEGGAARFTFEVPRGVEARVAATGLIGVSGPTETPGYAASADRVTVTVTGAAASVHIVPGP